MAPSQYYLCLRTLGDLAESLWESLCERELITSLPFSVESGELIGDVLVELAADDPLLSLYSERMVYVSLSGIVDKPCTS